MSTIDFDEKVCPCCQQSSQYLIPIDPGTVRIVKEIAKHIGKKGINAVHPRKELEGNGLSSNEVGNLSRPRIHGLIAKIPGQPGNYCITTKGAEFLHGASVPKYAIKSKQEKRTVGYFLPEKHRVTMAEVLEYKNDYWEGIDYHIVEGNVIKNN